MAPRLFDVAAGSRTRQAAGLLQDIAKSRGSQEASGRGAAEQPEVQAAQQELPETLYAGGRSTRSTSGAGRLHCEHEQLETKLYQDRFAAGDFDVACDSRPNFMYDPTAQFSKFLNQEVVAERLLRAHDARDRRHVLWPQRRTADVAERTKIVREMERYSWRRRQRGRSCGGSGSSSTTKDQRLEHDAQPLSGSGSGPVWLDE